MKGYGRRKWANGRTYIGEWENNEPNGQGKLTEKDGVTTWEGSFVNGRLWGQGTKTWPDGAVYSGEWANNKRNGVGTFTWPDSREYTG